MPPLGTWRCTHGTACWLADPAITQALARVLALDLTPLLQVADDDLGDIDAALEYLFTQRRDIAAIPAAILEPALAAIAACHAVRERAWTTPVVMLHALQALYDALGPVETPPAPALLEAVAAASGAMPFDDAYLTEGFFHIELEDLIVMTRFAILRGASRVRLWVA
ncbi:hypothetical protein EKD04_025855 [Chloroflexales bacterium ZM16-3]|nr:hypothetical protein [Chloroflexales bacterium ZM16-3]